MKLRGISLVIKFALTLFIARYMDFETLGLYGLISASSVMLPGFLGLGLMYTLSRKAVMQRKKEIAGALHYYRHFLLLVYLAVLIGAIITGIVLNRPVLAVMIALIIFFEHMNLDIYQLLLNLSKPFAANFLHFIRTAGWMLIFMLLALVFPSLRTLEVLLAMWVIGSVIALLGFFWDARGWLWLRKTENLSLKTWLTREFRESRTIYATGVAAAINQYAAHFLITAFLGLELMGVYIYFIQVISAMANLIQTGVIQIARPKMIRAHRENNDAYGDIYSKCLKHAALTAVAMAIVAGPALYGITLYVVEKPLAIEWFPVFWPLLFAFMLGVFNEVNGLVFYSQHIDSLILKFTLIAAIGRTICNAIFIPLLQLWGVTLSAILVGIFILFLHFRVIKQLNLVPKTQ